MAKLNRTCIVCSKKYEFCSSCKDQSTLAPWHSIFCSDNCRKVFNAASMYGKDSNEDIKAKLDECDLSNKENFHKNIIKVIDELYVSKKTVKPVLEESVEVVETIEAIETIEENNVETELKEKTENVELPKMTYKGRKRK